MIIGTDVDIVQCCQEGYLMMEIPPAMLKRKCFKGVAFDLATYKISYSLYANECLTGKERSFDSIERKLHNNLEYSLRVTHSLSGLLEMYQSKKHDIDSCCDCDHSKNPDDYTDIYQVFALAQSIDGYMGIDF